VDRSEAAGRLARCNARRCGLDGRAAVAVGVWGEALGGQPGFDLILCNPPYIPSSDIGALMPEVAGHEPRRALDGGADGLGAYRALMPSLAPLLQPGGCVVLELGQGQHEAVGAIGEAAGLVEAGCRADLGGIARALVLTLPPG
jgi:release factor glutamine methyltransferase